MCRLLIINKKLYLEDQIWFSYISITFTRENTCLLINISNYNKRKNVLLVI